MKVISFVLAWLLCLATAVVSLVWMLVAGLFGSERAVQIAVAYDQLGNATGAGDEDETVSARCWRLKSAPNYGRLQRAIDWLFFALRDETDHCESAFKAERARRSRPYVVIE